jgi:predicted ribonuclease toxin of YeeF-YezG toxin-antitoxin module
MAEIGSLLQGIFGIANIFQGANLIEQGGSLQANNIIQNAEVGAEGARLTAAGFRSAANSVQQATRFNLEIDALNAGRTLSNLARQRSVTLGTQVATVAASGLTLDSRSFVAVQNATMNTFDRGMLKLKIDAENVRRAKVFQSDVRQTNLENQARAADFSAAAQRVVGANQAAQAEFQAEASASRSRSSAFSQIPSLLGSIFSS